MVDCHGSQRLDIFWSIRSNHLSLFGISAVQVIITVISQDGNWQFVAANNCCYNYGDDNWSFKRLEGLLYHFAINAREWLSWHLSDLAEPSWSLGSG